jgi:hypothetical protein
MRAHRHGFRITFAASLDHPRQLFGCLRDEKIPEFAQQRILFLQRPNRSGVDRAGIAIAQDQSPRKMSCGRNETAKKVCTVPAVDSKRNNYAYSTAKQAKLGGSRLMRSYCHGPSTTI